MKISALILTRNEEGMIEDCLKQLDFVDEIIISDQNSQDKTRDIAQKYASKILDSKLGDFSANRTALAQNAKHDWLLYLDADERIDDSTVAEIKKRINSEKFDAYYFPRENYVLDRKLKHGGWWPDYVPRLFRKSKLEGWFGKVHESPKINGTFGYMSNPIKHYTARSLNLMLEKSIKWAKIEAEIASTAKHPDVNIARVIKAFIYEFISRYFFKLGILDGVRGLIQALFQGYHRCIMLIYLWEIQNKTQAKIKTIDNE